MNTAKLANAQTAAAPIVKKKMVRRGDVGKKNNGTTTGFSAVEKKASAEYGSKVAGPKVAGAIYQKMKSKGQL